MRRVTTAPELWSREAPTAPPPTASSRLLPGAVHPPLRRSPKASSNPCRKIRPLDRSRNAPPITWRKRVSIMVPAGSEQGLGEGRGVERAQVVDGFADTDEPDRSADFPRHRKDHAALRRAVELGQRQPGHPRELLEGLRLRDGIAAVGSVEHEQHLVGRPGHLPPDEVL